VKAVDTSIVVAALASWHESHTAALKALESRPVLPVASAIEAYAVLTRLPAPHRVDARLVRDLLAATFGGPGIGLSAEEDGAALVSTLSDRGISGGATYDAVIALVCLRLGATLLTLDARARTTYERIGVEIEYIG
jgi:predicted nucleic acid-binding protein